MRSVAVRCAAFAVVFAALGAACSQSVPESVSPPNDLRQTRVAGEYLVTLASGADTRAIVEVYGRLGIKGTQELGNGLVLVKFAEDPGLAKLDELRGRDSRVKAVQPNFVYHSFQGGKNKPQ